MVLSWVIATITSGSALGPPRFTNESSTIWACRSACPGRAPCRSWAILVSRRCSLPSFGSVHSLRRPALGLRLHPNTPIIHNVHSPEGRFGRRSSVVEQLFRKQQVTGSNPVVGSRFLNLNWLHSQEPVLLSTAFYPYLYPYFADGWGDETAARTAFGCPSSEDPRIYQRATSASWISRLDGKDGLKWRDSPRPQSTEPVCQVCGPVLN